VFCGEKLTDTYLFETNCKKTSLNARFYFGRILIVFAAIFRRFRILIVYD